MADEVRKALCCLGANKMVQRDRRIGHRSRLDIFAQFNPTSPLHDFRAVLAQLAGPLFMQRFFTCTTITDDLIDAIVDSYFIGPPED